MPSPPSQRVMSDEQTPWRFDSMTKTAKISFNQPTYWSKSIFHLKYLRNETNCNSLRTRRSRHRTWKGSSFNMNTAQLDDNNTSWLHNNFVSVVGKELVDFSTHRLSSWSKENHSPTQNWSETIFQTSPQSQHELFVQTLLAVMPKWELNKCGFRPSMPNTASNLGPCRTFLMSYWKGSLN